MAQQYFSPLVENAIRLASYWHKDQVRKGGEFTYFTHLAAVASILQQADFDETVIAAGYCHDLLEDTSCPPDEIASACSQDVLEIVESISEDKRGDISRDWERRKKAYIEQVKKASWQAKAVACADRIQNLQTLISSLEEYGLGYFDYYYRRPEKKLWFEDHFCMMLQDTWTHPLVDEYNILVDNFVDLLEELDTQGKNQKLDLDLAKTDFDQPETVIPSSSKETKVVEKIVSKDNEALLSEVRTLLERNLITQENLMKFIELQTKKLEKIATPPAPCFVEIKPKKGRPKSTNQLKTKYLKDDEFEYILPAALQLGILKGHYTNALLQKNLKINFTAAFRLLKELKRLHIIARADSNKPRKVDKDKAEEILKTIGKN